jgi:hypothetical protein
MTEGKPADWLDMADALTALRGQLAEAQARAWDGAIHLSVDEVTIEFGLELQRTAKGNGEFRFGVVSLGGGGERGRRATHKVSLRLKAHTDDGEPVDIRDEDDDE